MTTPAAEREVMPLQRKRMRANARADSRRKKIERNATGNIPASPFLLVN